MQLLGSKAFTGENNLLALFLKVLIEMDGIGHVTYHGTLSEIKPLFDKLVEAFSNVIQRMHVNFFIISIL